MERALKTGKTKADPQADEALVGVREEISGLLSEAYAMPCHWLPRHKSLAVSRLSAKNN